jgi:hypothetical protein
MEATQSIQAMKLEKQTSTARLLLRLYLYWFNTRKIYL